MTRGRHPKRFKVTWCVSFEPKERLLGQRALRQTETFRNEQDAKAFAKARLTDGSNINAGKLNPNQPKRIVTSARYLIGSTNQTTIEQAHAAPRGGRARALFLVWAVE
jgi:hypothetical protein